MEMTASFGVQLNSEYISNNKSKVYVRIWPEPIAESIIFISSIFCLVSVSNPAFGIKKYSQFFEESFSIPNLSIANLPTVFCTI